MEEACRECLSVRAMLFRALRARRCSQQTNISDCGFYEDSRNSGWGFAGGTDPADPSAVKRTGQAGTFPGIRLRTIAQRYDAYKWGE